MYNLQQVRVGEFEVYDSGCVTSIGNRDIVFTLTDNVRVRLHFESQDGEGQHFSAAVENNVLVITFVNFNNPLGTELTDAVEIGTLNGRRLFCHFRVLGMNENGNRVIFYTWLLGDNVNNG